MPNASRKRTRRRLVELACICLAVAQLGWFVFPNLDTLVRAEINLRDILASSGGGPPVKDDFVFVAIDDPSLKLDHLWPEDIEASTELTGMMQPWPWPRFVYAGAIEKILSAGAKMVLLDVVLVGEREGDAPLREVLDRFKDQVIIGSAFNQEATNPDHPELTSPSLRYPAASLIETPEGDPRIGFVNFWPDPIDRAIRTTVYNLKLKDQEHFSLAGRALQLLGFEDKMPAWNRQKAFRVSDLSKVPVVPFYTLFLPTDWERTLKNGEIFKDRIVVIGPSAAILHDVHLTPRGKSIPGPLLHVNVIAAALHDSFYVRAGRIARIVSVTIAAIFALLVSVILVRRPVAAFSILAGASAFYIALSWAIVSFAHYAPPVIQPGLVFLLAGTSCIAWNFAQERRESGRMRSMLERYVSRNLVREVLDQRDDFLSRLGGTRQPVTVFFSDVRGFTSFSESADASNVVEQLNEYLGEMVGVIFRHAGTVDKFMGDGIMAVWGNVVSEGPAADTARAVRAALEMQTRIATLNDRWRERDLRPFAVGMGLHHGEAVFGNIGSDEKMEPTVIGDTVNLASRVEGLTKKYGVAICVTQPIAELVRDQFLFRSVDLVQVVGKSRPVEILAVLGPRAEGGGAPSPLLAPPAWLARYETAIADFRARRFAEATEAFRACHGEVPDDKLCAIYLERAERFLAEPPPADWTGTEVATSK